MWYWHLHVVGHRFWHFDGIRLVNWNFHFIGNGFVHWHWDMLFNGDWVGLRHVDGIGPVYWDFDFIRNLLFDGVWLRDWHFHLHWIGDLLLNNVGLGNRNLHNRKKALPTNKADPKELLWLRSDSFMLLNS